MDASVGEAGQGDAKPTPSPPVHDFGSGRYSDYEAKWEPFVAGNFLVGGLQMGMCFSWGPSNATEEQRECSARDIPMLQDVLGLLLLGRYRATLVGALIASAQ